MNATREQSPCRDRVVFLFYIAVTIARTCRRRALPELAFAHIQGFGEAPRPTYPLFSPPVTVGRRDHARTSSHECICAYVRAVLLDNPQV